MTVYTTVHTKRNQPSISSLNGILKSTVQTYPLFITKPTGSDVIFPAQGVGFTGER